MYSLDINFLNDRAERLAEGPRNRTVAKDSVTPLYAGVAVGVFLPALVGALWLILNTRAGRLQERQAELDTQLAALQAQLQQVDAINAEISQIREETTALATVFNQIKPWSAILQDVRERVPTGVQVSSIEQVEQTVAPPPPPTDPNAPAPVVPPPPPPTVQVSGRARSFNDVNDFLLTLQRSAFLEGTETKLVSASLIDNPIQIQVGAPGQNVSSNIEARLPQVVEFTIQSVLSDVPASDLIQELERTLAVGLTTRIETLRERGVIEP